MDHLKRTKALLNSLSVYKKLTNDQKKNLKESNRCLYQNSIEINPANIHQDVRKTETCVRFIPIDGPANEKNAQTIMGLMSKDLKELCIEEQYHIITMLDAQKSGADLFLDYHFKAAPLPQG